MMLRPPVLVVLLALPVPAQTEARAVATFQRAFAQPKTAATTQQKDDALTALLAFDSARVAKALIAGYLKLEAEAEPVRQKRQKRLLSGGGSRFLKPMRNAVQPIRNLQERISAGLRQLEDKAAIAAMVKLAITSGSRMPMLLRIDLSTRAKDLTDADLDLLFAASRKKEKRNKNKRAQFAMPLLAALRHAGRRAARATPFALRQLENDLLDVRVEAAKTLAALCSPDALRPLIARAKLEDARGRDAMFDALEFLTGQNPGRSASAWGRWLAAEGGPYLAGETRLGRRRAIRRKAAPAAAGTGSYFGIPQDGNSILYVFDNSISMRAKIAGTGLTRMQRCKEELHRALDRLTPQKTFNLLAFANKLRMFSAEMQPATKQNVAAAKEWVTALQLELQTNIHDALELSFHLAGRGTTDRYYALAADTMFFLSDGAPTRPKPIGRGMTRDSSSEILAAVRRWNPLQRLVIHTILLGNYGKNAKQNHARRKPRNPNRRGAFEFMTQLAAQNGGEFVPTR